VVVHGSPGRCFSREQLLGCLGRHDYPGGTQAGRNACVLQRLRGEDRDRNTGQPRYIRPSGASGWVRFGPVVMVCKPEGVGEETPGAGPPCHRVHRVWAAVCCQPLASSLVPTTLIASYHLADWLRTRVDLGPPCCQSLVHTTSRGGRRAPHPVLCAITSPLWSFCGGGMDGVVLAFAMFITGLGHRRVPAGQAAGAAVSPVPAMRICQGGVGTVGPESRGAGGTKLASGWSTIVQRGWLCLEKKGGAACADGGATRPAVSPAMWSHALADSADGTGHRI